MATQMALRKWGQAPTANLDGGSLWVEVGASPRLLRYLVQAGWPIARLLFQTREGILEYSRITTA